MSGGHFDYKNYVLRDIAEEIQRIIKNNRVVNEWEHAMILAQIP